MKQITPQLFWNHFLSSFCLRSTFLGFQRYLSVKQHPRLFIQVCIGDKKLQKKFENFWRRKVNKTAFCGIQFHQHFLSINTHQPVKQFKRNNLNYLFLYYSTYETSWRLFFYVPIYCTFITFTSLFGKTDKSCQFHQHFNISFFSNFLSTKNSNTNLKYRKDTNNTFYDKAARKMLMKWTLGVNFTNLLAQSENAPRGIVCC